MSIAGALLWIGICIVAGVPFLLIYLWLMEYI